MTDRASELVRTPTELSSQGSDEDDRSELGPYVVVGPVRFGSDPNPDANDHQKDDEQKLEKADDREEADEEGGRFQEGIDREDARR